MRRSALMVYVQTGIRNAGRLTDAINSTLGNTVSDTASNTSTVLSLGSTNFPITAHVCELLVYSVAVSQIQQQRLEAYLAWKWGFEEALDDSNPFKAENF